MFLPVNGYELLGSGVEKRKHCSGREGAVGNGNVHDMVTVENGYIEGSIIHESPLRYLS